MLALHVLEILRLVLCLDLGRGHSIRHVTVFRVHLLRAQVVAPRVRLTGELGSLSRQLELAELHRLERALLVAFLGCSRKRLLARHLPHLLRLGHGLREATRGRPLRWLHGENGLSAHILPLVLFDKW